jgi:hypothetical protein
MTSKYFLLAIATTSLFIAGCATVKLTTDGEKVRILAPDEVATCKKLGTSNTSVTAKALGIPRPIETVSKELSSIGRNSAAKMGGDTIVPLTVIEDGQQSFVVYKCVAPEG